MKRLCLLLVLLLALPACGAAAEPAGSTALRNLSAQAAVSPEAPGPVKLRSPPPGSWFALQTIWDRNLNWSRRKGWRR